MDGPAAVVTGEQGMNEADVVQPHELTHTECMVVVAVGVLVAGYTLYMTNFGYGAMLCSAIAE